MKLYHGTNSLALDKILKHGLVPRSKGAKSNWKHTIESRRDAVYLTDVYPLYFALNACNHDRQHPVVLEIDTNRIQFPWKLVPDEDALEQTSRGEDGLPENWSMKKRTSYYRQRLDEWEGTEGWIQSLNIMGTCAHIGDIPKGAITRYVILDKKPQIDMCMVAMDAMIMPLNYQFMKGKYQALVKYLFDEKYEISDGERMDPFFTEYVDHLNTRHREGLTLVELKSLA